jgi:hypothetical protein
MGWDEDRPFFAVHSMQVNDSVHFAEFHFYVCRATSEERQFFCSLPHLFIKYLGLLMNAAKSFELLIPFSLIQRYECSKTLL